MSKQQITVGAMIAHYLHACGVKAAFGVISIHNMPILDAIHDQGHIRFISARGEAGATNMADACARSTGTLGVCLTSTGTAAGNAAGAMVEAWTAGTPLLHITGQIETPYLEKKFSYIHEAPDQLNMLKAISKAASRVLSAQTALGTLKLAIQTALTAPAGPVSVEIPIDIQAQLIDMPSDLAPLAIPFAQPNHDSVGRMAKLLLNTRRPMLWLGGGARGAVTAVKRLLDMGFGVVSSTQGRGIVSENHPQSLGAFNLFPQIEAFYQTCDAMLVVGSRLRGNETLKYCLKLPQPLIRLDADPQADGRGYANELFVCGDAQVTLNALADLLEGKLQIDSAFHSDLAQAYQTTVAHFEDGLGPYSKLVAQLQQYAGEQFNWVRDVTVSNSTWGNRHLKLFHPTAGVHALGGGIGQGLAMGIGAAIGASEYRSGRKTFTLAGDGGFILNLGELACAAQEKVNMIIVLMNDKGYSVIKNIQDAQYAGRRCYVELHTPDYALLSESLGIAHARVSDLKDLPAVLERAVAHDCVFLLEIDMLSIGTFKQIFAGPPIKKIDLSLHRSDLNAQSALIAKPEHTVER